MDSFFLLMRYHYEEDRTKSATYGYTYHCDHPVYSSCTLYFYEERGLAVIQQRYDDKTKHTYWTEIDPWLVDDIFLEEGFKSYFEKFSGEHFEKTFPTVTVRQIMHALGMKPLKKQKWETVFDRKFI